MPWKDATVESTRAEFCEDHSAGQWSMRALCRRYGISAKTGYKWLARFREGGGTALGDRSRRPDCSPTKTPPEVVAAILALKRLHPTWGPRKLLVRLASDAPCVAWPSASTAAVYLSREGLVVPSRRQRSALHQTERPPWSLTEPRKPNDVWTIDYKGQFRLGRDGLWCYPLTVMDLISRFLLRCHGMNAIETSLARASLIDAFREFGLPDVVRSDGGAPFASNAPARLSRLGVLLVRLGVRQELILPGHPEQNGAHERMHRTLNLETARPPKDTRRAQQKCFDAFRTEYNVWRPHEALAMDFPARRYSPSARPYPGKLPELEYPGHFDLYRVTSAGQIRFRGQLLGLSRVLAREIVGLEEIDDGIWDVRFGPLLLGRLATGARTLTGAIRGRA